MSTKNDDVTIISALIYRVRFKMYFFKLIHVNRGLSVSFHNFQLLFPFCRMSRK